MSHDSPGRLDLRARLGGRRVALFGASGFIGRWVARRLIDEDATLTCFARSPEQAATLLAKHGVFAPVLPGSAERPAEIAKALAQLAPEVTFNLTAYGVDPRDDDPDLAATVNGEFPENLARALSSVTTKWAGNSFVHVGTQYEYGVVEEFHEDTPAVPTTLYGKSKLAGTEAVMEVCEESGLSAVTARVFNVYGPGEGEHRLLPSLMAAAKSGQAIELTSGEQRRDFCFVQDVAEGILRLACAAPLGGDPVNLASGQTFPVKDLIVEAAHQLQIDPDLLRFGARPDRPQEVLNPRVSVERLRHLTGWLPTTPLAEGIRRTVAFVQHGS